MEGEGGVQAEFRQILRIIFLKDVSKMQVMKFRRKWFKVRCYLVTLNTFKKLFIINNL